MPLFMQVNSQVEQSVQSALAFAKTDESTCEEKLMQMACRFAKGLEMRKFEEHRDSIDHCLTNAEELAKYNELRIVDHSTGELDIKNKYYQG
jgi:hypothetical protein